MYLTVPWPSCNSLFQYFWETSSVEEEFGFGELWYRVRSGCRLKPEGSCHWFLLGSYILSAPCWSLLVQVFEQKWWSYPCSQVCQHFWETSSLLVGFGYGELWHRISSGAQTETRSSGALVNGTFSSVLRMQNIFPDCQRKKLDVHLQIQCIFCMNTGWIWPTGVTGRTTKGTRAVSSRMSFLPNCPKLIEFLRWKSWSF